MPPRKKSEYEKEKKLRTIDKNLFNLEQLRFVTDQFAVTYGEFTTSIRYIIDPTEFSRIELNFEQQFPEHKKLPQKLLPHFWALTREHGPEFWKTHLPSLQHGMNHPQPNLPQVLHNPLPGQPGGFQLPPLFNQSNVQGSPGQAGPSYRPHPAASHHVQYPPRQAGSSHSHHSGNSQHHNQAGASDHSQHVTLPSIQSLVSGLPQSPYPCSSGHPSQSGAVHAQQASQQYPGQYASPGSQQPYQQYGQQSPSQYASPTSQQPYQQSGQQSPSSQHPSQQYDPNHPDQQGAYYPQQHPPQ